MKKARKIPTFFWEHPSHKPPPVDIDNYELTIDGCLKKPLRLRLAELPTVASFITRRRRFYCVNGWSMEDDWGGYLLADILREVQPEAEFLRTTSIGGYEDTTPISDLLRSGSMLATHMSGEPLPPKRGFPLRLLVFDLYQFKGVKSVAKLHVTDEYRPGTWQRVGYRDAAIQPYPHLDINTGDQLMPATSVLNLEE